jgi:hypothetical protein
VPSAAGSAASSHLTIAASSCQQTASHTTVPIGCFCSAQAVLSAFVPPGNHLFPQYFGSLCHGDLCAISLVVFVTVPL